MSLAQLKSNGDLEATEFSEISYVGKGDGSTVYIDTLVTPNTFDIFEIKFKCPIQSEQTVYGCIFGAIGTMAGRYLIYMGSSAVYWGRVWIGSMTYLDIAPYLTEGDIYTLTITKNSTLNYTITLKDVDDTQLYTHTGDTTDSISSALTCYIYDRHYSSSKSKAEIYYFTINDETWYINNGSGSTITGSLGTVLNINGTLTNFWQESEIWNEDANLKMYNTGLVKCEEFNEVATTYAGKGDGSTVYIDTGIPANTIDNFEIVFKYNLQINNSVFGSIDGSPLQRFYLLDTGTNVYVYIGDSYQWAIGSYMTENHIMKLSLVHNTGLNYTIIITDITENIVKYTDTKNITGIIATNNLYLYARNYSSKNFSLLNIYSFTINDETWYINNGSGSTITGSLGTVLNINGTLTNFWQESEIWNDPAQMKLLANEVDIKNEILEI